MTEGIIVGAVGGVAVVITAVVGWLATRGKTAADAKTALDQRIDSRVQKELDRVYARLDEFEDRERRRNSAFARILRAIATQWPDPHGPDLDPADIAEVEDTVPTGWIRRKH